MKRIEHLLADRVAQAQQKVEASRESLAEATEQVTTSIAMMDRLSMIIALGAVLLAVGAGWLLTRIIVQPIRAVSERLKEIAHGDGDLTQRADDSRSDELGELARHFNQFVQNIHNIIAKLRRVGEEVVVAASQIASVSDQVSSSTSQQQQQVEQISAVIGQISQSIHDVAGQSEAVAGNAADAGQLARDGGAVVGRTIDDMRSIGSAVQAAAQRVEQLSARSDQIGQIIQLIDEIAEQTNLLALNAAIEAARAGAAGRGFAVVADEVRKLADRTTQATANVAEAIEGIQRETGSAIQVMQQGTAQVDTGLGQADEAGQSLQQIVEAAQQVAGKVQTIASAAVEQSAATEQVSSSVESIARIAQHTHEGVDQAIDAVQRLNDRAHQVQALLSHFKLNETTVPATQTAAEPTELAADNP
jgi:methyl-accepting chemotaxis protein